MSPDPDGADRRVLSSRGTRTVLLARTVPGSVDQVWAACTDPERLPGWLGVRPEGQLEYGQHFRLYGADCRVVGCVPPQRLELSWTLHGETNTVRLGVAARPGGTELTVEHSGIRDLTLLGYGPSWEERVVHLIEYLEGRPVPQHDCGTLDAELRGYWRQVLDPMDRSAI